MATAFPDSIFAEDLRVPQDFAEDFTQDFAQDNADDYAKDYAQDYAILLECIKNMGRGAEDYCTILAGEARHVYFDRLFGTEARAKSKHGKYYAANIQNIFSHEAPPFPSNNNTHNWLIHAVDVSAHELNCYYHHINAAIKNPTYAPATLVITTPCTETYMLAPFLNNPNCRIVYCIPQFAALPATDSYWTTLAGVVGPANVDTANAANIAAFKRSTKNTDGDHFNVDAFFAQV